MQKERVMTGLEAHELSCKEEDAKVDALWEEVSKFREDLLSKGYPLEQVNDVLFLAAYK
jgi:hypothetical protein